MLMCSLCALFCTFVKCAYVYMYMFVCMLVHMCVCVCLCVHMCVCVSFKFDIYVRPLWCLYSDCTALQQSRRLLTEREKAAFPTQLYFSLYPTLLLILKKIT